MIKLFDPQVVFEYSVAVIATMVAAGMALAVGHLLLTLLERL
jgi:hypothetical protein